MFNNILFVCTGNICRSPMAEGLYREKLWMISSNIEVSSAGIGALVGKPAVSEAKKTMEQIGIDISAHKARQVTEEILMAADLVLVMEDFHKQHVELVTPHVKGRVFLIGHWDNFEIPDPYKRPIQNFAECLQFLEKSWEKWKLRL